MSQLATAFKITRAVMKRRFDLRWLQASFLAFSGIELISQKATAFKITRAVMRRRFELWWPPPLSIRGCQCCASPVRHRPQSRPTVQKIGGNWSVLCTWYFSREKNRPQFVIRSTSESTVSYVGPSPDNPDRRRWQTPPAHPTQQALPMESGRRESGPRDSCRS